MADPMSPGVSTAVSLRNAAPPFAVPPRRGACSGPVGLPQRRRVVPAVLMKPTSNWASAFGSFACTVA